MKETIALTIFILCMLGIVLTVYFGELKYKEQLANKDLAIKSIVDYYEDEDRRLLLEANELLRLRKEIK